MLIDGLEKGLAWDFESGKGGFESDSKQILPVEGMKSREKVVSEKDTSEVFLIFLLWYFKLVRLVLL